MATKFLFQEIEITNYRGIKQLKIEKLKRINLVGGYNSSGKSTLLDAIFLVLDRKNVLTLNRPFTTKGLPVPFPNGLDYIFNNELGTKRTTISLTTKDGKMICDLEKGPAPKNSAASHSINYQANMQGHLSSSTISGDGIRIKTRYISQQQNKNSIIDEVFIAQRNHQEIEANFSVNENICIYPCSIIQNSGLLPPAEIASRISQLDKSGGLPNLIRDLNLIEKDISGIKILVDGGQPVAYIKYNDGNTIQAGLLGGGVQMVLNLSLMMLSSKDGVLLLDEIDSSIHYSIHLELWELIAKLADKYNCQVFMVTHSKDFIKSALNGIKKSGLLKDLNYFRLEKTSSATVPVPYSSEELQDAFDSGWEVR